MSQSFSDIRQAVSSALAQVDKDGGDDLCVSDVGPDWVVYSDPDTTGGGLFRRGYSMDADGAVKFTSTPTRVARQTTYNEISGPSNLKDAAAQAKQHFKARREDK